MTFAVLLLSILPHAPIVAEHADQIERNELYDEEGKHVFTQLIFRDFTGTGFSCFDFRVLKDQPTFSGNTLLMQDGESFRVISATSIVESWTQYDPEIAERETLPKSSRRGLKSWQSR